jgi:hypothetical protein
MALDVEAGFLYFVLYPVCGLCMSFILPNIAVQSSNSVKAFEEGASVIRGLVDGAVRIQYPPGANALTAEKPD